jgi:hypothetical protein
MTARNFFAEVKRRNISEVALMSWLEEQNKGREIGSMVERDVLSLNNRISFRR